MSQEEIRFLKEDLPSVFGRTIYGKTLHTLYTAEMLLNGWSKIKKRGCSCELQGLHDGVKSKYNQWLKENTSK